MTDGIHLYSVIAKHDWLTNEPIEAMVVVTSRLDETLAEIRERVPREAGYLAVVTGLSLSEAHRIASGPIPPNPSRAREPVGPGGPETGST